LEKKKSNTFYYFSLLSTSTLDFFYFFISLLSGSNLGLPGKPHPMEDSYSPYNLMSSSESPTSPLVPQDSWGQGKSTSDKMTNGTNINWPPGQEHLKNSTDVLSLGAR